jgi:hypothetical protein
MGQWAVRSSSLSEFVFLSESSELRRRLTPNKVAPSTTLLYCSWEVLGSNLGWTLTILA